MFQAVFHRKMAVVLLLGLFANAALSQQVQIPPASSNEKNDATSNVIDIVRSLEQHGLKGPAAELTKFLNDGRLFWHGMGKDAPSGAIGNSADGKNILSLRADFLGGENDSGGLNRYQAGSDEHIPYRATITILHELVHHEQPLSLRQDGTFNQDYINHNTKKITPDIVLETGVTLLLVRSELEAYQKSLKSFTEQFILPTVERYFESKNRLHSAGQARLLQDIQSMLLALTGVVRTTPEDCSDRVSRWQAILITANTLHDVTASLRADAESRAECSEMREKYQKITQTKKQELAKVERLKAELTSKLGQQKSALQAAIAKVGNLRRDISQSSNRLTIAGQISELDNFIRLQRPRIRKLEDEQKAAIKQKRFLERSMKQDEGLQRQLTSQFDQCRKNYVADMMADDELKPSQLPPDMKIGDDGELKSRRTAKDYDQKGRDLAKKLKDLFSFDPDKLKNSDDPRTPEVSQKSEADQTDRAYVIYLDQKSDTQIYLVDKKAGVDNDKIACKSKL